MSKKLPQNLDDVLYALHKEIMMDDGSINESRLEIFKLKVKEYEKNGFGCDRYRRYISHYNGVIKSSKKRQGR